MPQERQIDFLNWPRTTRDPFEGEWEHILAEVLAHPERSSGNLFQELQQQSPGRYQPNGWFQVLSYLEYYRPTEGFSQEKQGQEAPLFLSETYQPLTINALTLLFGRLRKRAEMTEEPVTPSLLRDTFAVLYLQAGGEPEVLRAILGLTGMESVKRYEQISPQKEPAEQHRSKAMAVPQKRKRRRRRPSSAATRSQQQRGADRTHRAGKKKPAADAEEDP